MKTTIKRVRQNCSAARALKQALRKPAKPPAEFKIVRLRECPVDNPILAEPPQVEKFWREHVVNSPGYNSEHECACVILLNTRRRMIGFELLSQGTLDMLLIHPRDVFRMATARNAAAAIIAHNHPSGDPTPSDADIKVTNNLIRAGEMMQIELVDSVVIGAEAHKPSCFSIRSLGYWDEDVAESVTAVAAETDAASSRKESARQKPTALVPSQVVAEMTAANAELNSAGSAAVATALLHAYQFRSDVENFTGWEDFDTPRLRDGIFEMVRTAGNGFDSAFQAWQDYSCALADRVRNCNTVVKIIPHNLCDHKLLAGFEKNDASLDIENAVGALKQCVFQQGSVMAEQKENSAAFFLGVAIKERLERAFDSAWAAQTRLTAAFFAVEAANRLKPEAEKLAA